MNEQHVRVSFPSRANRYKIDDIGDSKIQLLAAVIEYLQLTMEDPEEHDDCIIENFWSNSITATQSDYFNISTSDIFNLGLQMRLHCPAHTADLLLQLNCYQLKKGKKKRERNEINKTCNSWLKQVQRW